MGIEACARLAQVENLESPAREAAVHLPLQDSREGLVLFPPTAECEGSADGEYPERAVLFRRELITPEAQGVEADGASGNPDVIAVILALARAGPPQPHAGVANLVVKSRHTHEPYPVLVGEEFCERDTVQRASLEHSLVDGDEHRCHSDGEQRYIGEWSQAHPLEGLFLRL